MHDQNCVMYVPVDSNCVFLRALITREELEALVEQIPVIDPIGYDNAKALKNGYQACMSAHIPTEWIRVLKTVYLRLHDEKNPNRRLSDTERTTCETAGKYLLTEVSLALGVTVQQAREYLACHLQFP
jgi:CarD family transcriptional regulator